MDLQALLYRLSRERGAWFHGGGAVSDSFLAFLGVMLHLEQAILWLAVAQAATAVGVLVVALSLERILRFFRSGDRRPKP
jgi:hypothetical protein